MTFDLCSIFCDEITLETKKVNSFSSVFLRISEKFIIFVFSVTILSVKKIKKQGQFKE